MNWISLHIYHNDVFENVLNGCMYPLKKKLEEDISQLFFIRYWEGGQHIRFRVLPKTADQEEELRGILMDEVRHYFFQVEDASVEFSLEFEEYVPEVDRYGGEELMLLAEEHFQDSSETILELLYSYQFDWNYTEAITSAIKMHLVLAREVIQNKAEAISFFEFTFNRWFNHSVKLDSQGRITDTEAKKVLSFFQSSYDKQKAIITALIEEIWNNNINTDWMDDWAEKCQKLIPVLNDETDWKSILDSCVHMTNNRLGIYLRDEAFISYLLVRGLQG